MRRVERKRALIVGAGGHIGAAVTLRLAEEGALVHLAESPEIGLDGALESIEPTGGGIAHHVDLHSAEAIRAVVDEIETEHGSIDILVVTSWGHAFSRIDDLSEEDWLLDLDVNLSTTYRSVHAVAPHMRKRGHGRIVTISSTAKDGVPWFKARGHSGHAAARGGVVGLTRALCYELGSDGITVNCVVVGPLDNPKAQKAFNSVASDATVKAGPLDMIALGRFGSPRDVANAVLFLASDEAAYITGESLYVSGGLYG
jgi:NAD(P)-dependent dehydrogenase (short-subunit alcohol dehydrogenase family)